MIYGFLKILIRITLRIFYKKVTIHKPYSLPKDGAFIVMGNHPNTFMDPLIVATLFRQQVGFLGNASIFANKALIILFNFFRVIPVYREKDVAPGEKMDNAKTFRDCYTFLENKNTILMFPEGSSYHELKLRKIKTGGSRIALGVEQKNDFKLGLKIIPVGLYYSDPAKFRSKIYVNIGEMINVSDFQNTYQKDEVEGVKALTSNIKAALESLTINTSDKEQEALFLKIKRIYKNYMVKKHATNGGKHEEYLMTKEIAEGLQYFKVNDHQLYEALELKIKRCDELLNHFKTSSKHTVPIQNLFKKLFIILTGTLYGIVGFPLYIMGLIHNYIPYRTPLAIAKKMTSEPEYYAPIMMSLGILFFPLYYYLCFLVFDQFFLTSLILKISYLISLPLTGFFVLHYTQFVKSGVTFLKIHNIINPDRELREELEILNQEVISGLDEARLVYLARV